VAQITAIPAARKPIDAAALRAVTDQMPLQPQGAGGLMRLERDDARF
jgi:hypothetical protein